MSDRDTIFALATPPGRSALAVLRVSGSLTIEVIASLTGTSLPPFRKASLRRLVNSRGEPIDDAIVTLFRGPNSFTGEDSAEFSVHGSRSVISALSSALSGMPGVRAAGPGEFTRRAFINGRLDLTQAEAIADLIDSETESQRRQALRVLGGSFGSKVREWNARLLEISAELEAVLDFSDEGDVDELVVGSIDAICVGVESEMRSELDRSAQTLALRDGFTVVLAGVPNAGKSSLFNQLAGEDAAIVTSVPGTTRDLISRTLEFEGMPIKLIDSAGLRVTDDQVEQAGVDRARSAASSADLVLWLSSPEHWALPPSELGDEVLVVSSKKDILPNLDYLSVSVYDTASVAAIRAEIAELARRRVGDGSQGQLIRDRHRLALVNALAALDRLRGQLCEGRIELAAEECRFARNEIGGIVGYSTPEDVLGEIFQRFCIGK